MGVQSLNDSPILPANNSTSFSYKNNVNFQKPSALDEFYKIVDLWLISKEQ